MVALHRLSLTPVAALAALLLPSAATADQVGLSVVAEVNVHRVLAGAPPLKASRPLERSSRRWARRLARRGVLRHSRMRDHRGDFRRLAEVIGRQPGRRPWAHPAVAAWMSSPAHRAVLLDPGLRLIGVGHAPGKRATYWVAQLAAR